MYAFMAVHCSLFGLALFSAAVTRGDEPAEVDFNQVVGTEKTVIGSVAASPGDYAMAVGMIASGRVDVKPLISAKVPLERAISDGFERMIQPEKDVFRILVGSG